MKNKALDIILLGTLTVVLVALYSWSANAFHTVVGLYILYMAVTGLYNLICDYTHKRRMMRKNKRG